MAQADIVFLLDESWSSGQSGFSGVKNFISSLISSFKGSVVGTEGVRFGVTVFGDVPRWIRNANTQQRPTKINVRPIKLYYRKLECIFTYISVCRSCWIISTCSAFALPATRFLQDEDRFDRLQLTGGGAQSRQRLTLRGWVQENGRRPPVSGWPCVQCRHQSRPCLKGSESCEICDKVRRHKHTGTNLKTSVSSWHACVRTICQESVFVPQTAFWKQVNKTKWHSLHHESTTLLYAGNTNRKISDRK